MNPGARSDGTDLRAPVPARRPAAGTSDAGPPRRRRPSRDADAPRWPTYLPLGLYLPSTLLPCYRAGLSHPIGSGRSVDLGSLAAGGAVAAVPVVIVFAFIQKWLVAGFSAGAVKG